MRSRTSNRNHPMQPLSPKRQPWVMSQVAGVALARSPKEARVCEVPSRTVEQELELRARIEQRAAIKLEKLHDAVYHDRNVRRVQRLRVTGNVGDFVKQELSKVSAAA